MEYRNSNMLVVDIGITNAHAGGIESLFRMRETTGFIDDYVRRLEITVDDSGRMCCGQGITNLNRILQSILQGQRTALSQTVCGWRLLG
jgi:hypothetical protein